MRKLFSLFIMALFIIGFTLQTADAARFGGGRSFGMQRSVSSFSRMREPVQMPQQGTPANRWLGPLAGFAAGGLLASLFMGHGIGGGMLSWLVMAMVAMMAWGFIRRMFQPATQSASYNNQAQPTILRDVNTPFMSNTATSQNNYPLGFEPTAFIRDAKVQFIRLQAAYDTKNLADLREFTAPQVFGEIQLQLQERGDAINQTEVVTLEAELLDATAEAQSTVASVHFSGMIREQANQPAAPFSETWHFRKDNMSSTWMVMGVQQQDIH